MILLTVDDSLQPMVGLDSPSANGNVVHHIGADNYYSYYVHDQSFIIWPFVFLYLVSAPALGTACMGTQAC